ncbi:HXXEE domain-containing protein [Roseisolibacter agri]|uniref:HXXEE domain-containing protein n=1 Tax=Roseisolibacter agri TaxID=2014610 RepID=A0AA37Q765_9BACT|nr:HXXEE domain-containing protein [Roseisolibacter agri]GLC25942.1 hypothetical protein rosag_24550 [Roseisolibacter agri]
MTRRRLLLWLPLAFALHNAEEALTLARAFPVVRERAPALAVAVLGPADPGHAVVLTALGVATLLPLVVALWALARPASVAARWAVLLVTTAFLVNAASHVATALWLHAGHRTPTLGVWYAPGLVTAVLVNLPLTLHVLRRAARERWLSSRGQWRWLLPAAILLHGPGVLGAWWLGRWLGER